MHAIPMTQRAANAWIAEHHRHLKPPRGDLFRIAAARPAGDGDEVVMGVVVVGRPVARGLQDGRTCEVIRLAVAEGQKNVCSFLYARAARVAEAMGYRRIVTYTRADEPGTSLLAAGWARDGEVYAREWACNARERSPSEQGVIAKVRWLKTLGG